jgi:hypothetical protein
MWDINYNSKKLSGNSMGLIWLKTTALDLLPRKRAQGTGSTRLGGRSAV